jgi:Asp-tRNA(Asn)/Glu-tRNA(Gln) amidotransferase A subunit family amidase
MPLSGNRDVVGPIARCVRDAALCLDVLSGYSAEDPKTLAGVGRKPPHGYTSKLNVDGLKGIRLGLYGPGWRNQPLSAETKRIYDRAARELEAQGAILIEDPFAGTGFADLRQTTLPLPNFDARGMESVPYDLQKYLERLGPNAAIKSFKEFAEATASEACFGPDGVLSFMNTLPQFRACLQSPTTPPDLSDFISLKDSYLRIVDEVFNQNGLDALVFPQIREELPLINLGQTIQETTVGEINIAGIPGVVVPAGYYESGCPFSLIFVGRLWSEVDLLSYAYAYESATHHRKVPLLSQSNS